MPLGQIFSYIIQLFVGNLFQIMSVIYDGRDNKMSWDYKTELN